MSADEQEALIGRLVIERKRAQQQSALLWSEILDVVILFGNISGNVGGKNQSMDFVLAKIEEVLKRGGLEKLKERISERNALNARIADITETLKAAGAE